MSKKNLIFTTIVISILCSSTLIHSLDVPDEAREIAEAYLKLRGLKASLSDPYPRYVMDSQDLQRITEDESSLIANADFVCFEFPYLINGKPRGMIGVRDNGEQWEYYKSSGQEPLYSVIHDLREERPEAEISLLSIDSHKFFAVVVLKDKTILIPENPHTHDMFKGTVYEGEEFPWVSYSIAHSVLKEYAASKIDKGCIKHEK
jgi:hypothetical protein